MMQIQKKNVFMRFFGKPLIGLFIFLLFATACIMPIIGGSSDNANACEKEVIESPGGTSNSSSGQYANKDQIKAALSRIKPLTEQKAAHMPANNGSVTAAFGETEYHTVPHGGVDIGSTGNLYAVVDGVVIESTFNKARGHMIVLAFLDTQNQWKTYLHQHMAEKPTKSVGEYVTAGEVLGTSGNTGDSQGVHLHMEVGDVTIDADGLPHWVNHAQKESGLYDPMTYFGLPNPLTAASNTNTSESRENNPAGSRCTSNGGVVTNLKGNSNVEKTWNFLKEKGFSDEGSAGIIGNFMVESQLDPLAGEAGGNGGGRGIAQWGQCGTASNGANAGCRWKELEKWAASNGNVNPDELSTQLGFVYHEMEARGLIEYFKTVNVLYTAEGSAYGGGAVGKFCEKFEAPAVQYAHMNKRHSYAMDALAQFGGR